MKNRCTITEMQQLDADGRYPECFDVTQNTDITCLMTVGKDPPGSCVHLNCNICNFAATNEEEMRKHQLSPDVHTTCGQIAMKLQTRVIFSKLDRMKRDFQREKQSQ